MGDGDAHRRRAVIGCTYVPFGCFRKQLADLHELVRKPVTWPRWLRATAGARAARVRQAIVLFMSGSLTGPEP